MNCGGDLGVTWAKALTHPLRVRILRQMVEADSVSPSQAARTFGALLGDTNYHVRRLCDLNVIEPTRRGRGRNQDTRYRLVDRTATRDALWRIDATPPRSPEPRASHPPCTKTLIRRYRSAEELRRRREELGLSRRQLATLTGIGADYLGRIERGQSDPRVSALYALADELRIPLIDILDPDPSCFSSEDLGRLARALNTHACGREGR
jgi:ribosome-binding protein aMBF1 (putative translation factor)